MSRLASCRTSLGSRVTDDARRDRRGVWKGVDRRRYRRSSVITASRCRNLRLFADAPLTGLAKFPPVGAFRLAVDDFAPIERALQHVPYRRDRPAVRASPLCAGRRRADTIQCLGNAVGTGARRIPGEDIANNRGLRLVDDSYCLALGPAVVVVATMGSWLKAVNAIDAIAAGLVSDPSVTYRL